MADRQLISFRASTKKLVIFSMLIGAVLAVAVQRYMSWRKEHPELSHGQALRHYIHADVS